MNEGKVQATISKDEGLKRAKLLASKCEKNNIDICPSAAMLLAPYDNSLMCTNLAPTLSVKQANEFLKPIFVAELWFVDNKLRSIITRLTENPSDYFVILATEVKRIIGLAQVGFSDDDVRKFNSGLKDQLFLVWEDGNQGVIVNITIYPDGGKSASLNIFAAGFNYNEEIGE